MTKQERASKIVRDNVIYCVSTLVDDLLKEGILSYDDMCNLTIDKSDEIDEKEDEISDLGNEISDLEDEIRDLYENDDEELGVLETELISKQKQLEVAESELEELQGQDGTHQEAYEWWIVDDWLANILKERDEIILECDYFTAWGRGTSGQAIEIDSVILDIAEYLNRKYGEYE